MNYSDAGRRQAGRRRCGLIRRFLVEDAGQDIVEYAFLAAFIGIAGWVTLQALDNEVYNVYSGWVDPDTGTPGLWRPPGPDGLPEPLDP